jgi:uncharacterized membrane protein
VLLSSSPQLIADVLDPYLTDWLDLLLRWLHVIAAMAWIGTSFYFVLLDSSLRAPKSAQDVKDGVGGELWEVHGGGFYHVKKYRVAPPTLPEHLAWFKWEAYTTWLSGFGLLVVLYYFEARAHLIDPAVADLTPAQAVGISIGLLLASWLVYDALCRALVAHEGLLAGLLVGATAVATWGCSELFAPRAAFLQLGAMLGTIMAGNVLFNIIPAHWELIRAKQEGREPDPQPAIVAKQRSVHNNYLTLPVLLTMLAGHVAFLYEVERPWLVLFVLMLLGVWARLFFNLRHTGRTIWTIPAIGIAAVILVAVIVEPDDEGGTAATPAQIAAGKAVFASAGCGKCHTLADAGATGTVGPNLDEQAPSRARVAAMVRSGAGVMPSFRDTLSEQQIEAVALYVSATAGK